MRQASAMHCLHSLHHVKLLHALSENVIDAHFMIDNLSIKGSMKTKDSAHKALKYHQ